jgi:filamentous hemagglutinin
MQPGVGTNRYSYSFGDPVNGIDPSGHATYVTPDNATSQRNDYLVKKVIKDGDLNIYVLNGNEKKGKLRVIGETRFWDAFISPDGKKNVVGKLYAGHSIDKYVKVLKDYAASAWQIEVGYRSLPNNLLDIKTTYPGHETGSYHGFLLDGKYVTLREAGNILAGYNAAQKGLSFEEFQKKAGTMQGVSKPEQIVSLLLGTVVGEAPNWGENDYQRLRSEFGYYQYIHEQKDR